MAFSPKDATGNILYISMPKGTGAAGTILKSANRGTWTDLNMPIWLNQIIAIQKGTTQYQLPHVKKLSQELYILTVREWMMSSTKVLIQ